MPQPWRLGATTRARHRGCTPRHHRAVHLRLGRAACALYANNMAHMWLYYKQRPIASLTVCAHSVCSKTGKRSSVPSADWGVCLASGGKGLSALSTLAPNKATRVTSRRTAAADTKCRPRLSSTGAQTAACRRTVRQNGVRSRLTRRTRLRYHARMAVATARRSLIRLRTGSTWLVALAS